MNNTIEHILKVRNADKKYASGLLLNSDDNSQEEHDLANCIRETDEAIWFISALSQPPVIDKQELSKKYYEACGRGDFQNETDYLDVESVWNFFTPYLSTDKDKEMAELKAEMIKKELEVEKYSGMVLELEREIYLIEGINGDKKLLKKLDAGKILNEYWRKTAFSREREISSLTSKLSDTEKLNQSMILRLSGLTAKVAELEKANEKLKDGLKETRTCLYVKYMETPDQQTRNILDMSNELLLPSPPKPKTT